MATYDEEVLADSPKGYWKLNETSTATASTHADSSGNGKTMTLAGTGPFQSGKPLRKLLADRSRYLNGIAQYMYRTYESYFSFTRITMECWAYCTSTANGYSICKVQSGGYAQTIGDSYIGADVYAGGAYRSSSATITSNGLPRHYVSTWDGQYVKNYIDGAEVSSYNYGSVANITHGTNASIMIGANPSGTGSGIDAGSNPMAYLSNVAIYDTALSAARILAHYNAARMHVTATITESLAATAFNVSATDTDGYLCGLSTTSSGEQTIEVDTALPVFVTIRPEIGAKWQASTSYALNALAFPTDPITTPYYYKRIVAGSSAATEPTWPTTPGGKCNDGTTDDWECIERLVQPITHGPLIPT